MELSLQESFDHIYIQKESLDSPIAKRAYSLFDPSIIEVVTEKPLQEKHGTLSTQDYEKSKRLLYLAPFKGEFFKRCPGAKPGLACCNYFVLNLGLQCNMNCSYCYLQSYINSPLLTVYTNIHEALLQIKEMATLYPDRIFRVGTGEVTDSLSLDDLTLYSRDLITFFRDLPNWKLEFKTKSSKVDQFLDVPHAHNVICSWSVNPQNIVEREEHLTASLEKRLEAARKCADKGYTISFHIDPMIWHPEWRESYQQLVREITSRFTPKEVTYITAGALRFQPEQRHMMRERFHKKLSFVTRGEMFTGKDGKMRYDQAIRSEMFDFLKNQFKEDSPLWRISFCMELPETWSMTMSSSPSRIPELKELFLVRKQET